MNIKQPYVGFIPNCSEAKEQSRNNEERPYGHDRLVSLQPQLSSYPYPAVYNFGNALPNLPDKQMFSQLHGLKLVEPFPLSIPLTVPLSEKNEKCLRRGKWTVSHANDLSS